LTRPRFESTIYRTLGGHANHYTTADCTGSFVNYHTITTTTENFVSLCKFYFSNVCIISQKNVLRLIRWMWAQPLTIFKIGTSTTILWLHAKRPHPFINMNVLNCTWHDFLINKLLPIFEQNSPSSRAVGVILVYRINKGVILKMLCNILCIHYNWQFIYIK
jgi:hypothetical protein